MSEFKLGDVVYAHSMHTGLVAGELVRIEKHLEGIKKVVKYTVAHFIHEEDLWPVEHIFMEWEVYKTIEDCLEYCDLCLKERRQYYINAKARKELKEKEEKAQEATRDKYEVKEKLQVPLPVTPSSARCCKDCGALLIIRNGPYGEFACCSSGLFHTTYSVDIDED